MKIYKLLSIVLATLLLVGGAFFVFEKYSNSKKRRELNNLIAGLTDVVQETETAYSRRAVETDNLRLENEELRTKINDRDEEAVVLTETVIRWKNKYIKAKNTKETVVDKEDRIVVIEPQCEDCFAAVRFKVDFDETQDPLRVHGFTLTNPSEAEINIEWIRDLKLSLILTKDDDDLFRVYLDTNDSDVETSDLKLSVDPSILDRSWYEKIGVDGAIGIGEGFASLIGLRYDVFDNWAIGPAVILYYDGNSLKKMYGISTTFYPFR